MQHRLTSSAACVNSAVTGRWGRPIRRLTTTAGVVLGVTLATTGCVSVTAPDKPIVIELNINIKQEVVYRLASDAGKTIQSNKEIF
ncbi:MAG: YnbE family lipoprotein [Novosphingobium sp.]|nr:YnbE family lipoprotein [Novosphingobium sp.]